MGGRPTSSVNDLKLTLSSKEHGGHDGFSGLLLMGLGANRRGVVLCHGRNAHPDAVVVGLMRKSLHELGYTTLSIQNPIPKAGDEFPNYAADIKGENYVFTEAYARVRTSIAELKRRGIAEIVLFGFSMGARMQAAYLARSGASALPIVGLIVLGGKTNGISPLNIASNLEEVTIPVLDVCGEGDTDTVSSTAARKIAYNSGEGKSYTQVILKGAVPHDFGGHENELKECLHKWMMSMAPA